MATGHAAKDGSPKRRRAHGLSQMQDSLKHADSDLAHAQELYNSVAPLFNGVQLAERVSLERDKAAKSLAQAAQIQNPRLTRRRRLHSGGHDAGRLVRGSTRGVLWRNAEYVRRWSPVARGAAAELTVG